MTDALVLGLIVGATNGLTGLVTWATARAKNRTEGEQTLIKTLIEERKYLHAELLTCHEEIRKLRTDVELLQARHKHRAEQDDVLDELDKRIRHDGSTLIRNLLTRAEDGGLDVADLKEKARTLERVRDMRREAAGQGMATAMVPR